MLKEDKIISRICTVLETRHNLGLAVITSVIWIVMFLLPYYNTNYDMTVNFFTSVTLFSGASILVSLVSKDRDNLRKIISKYAIVSFLLSLVTLIMTKAIMFHYISIITLVPLSIFVFMLLLKNIFLAIQK